MSLQEKLRQRLSTQPFISVAEYMEMCLLDPEHGYYTTQNPFGAAGDFITAPEISQIFGEIIGAWAANAWLEVGSPKAAIVELGGGRGTLMRDALKATRHVPEFHTNTQIIMVEASAALAEVQRQTLHDAHPRISTQAALLPLPAQPCFFIANEFFDALPIQQFIYENHAWKERGIFLSDAGTLAFTTRTARASLAPAREGDIVEVCAAAENIMQQLCDHIKKYGGALIVADYGYAKPGYGDTLQALKSHRFVDVLAYPGESDLTAHVNFSALAAIVRKCGLIPTLETQGDFLRKNGAELRANTLCKALDAKQQAQLVQGLERLIAPQHMGELFKVMVAVA